MFLLLHHGAIGDFLLTLPLAGTVRAHLGRPRLETIASAASARWAAQQGLIDACHSPESVGLHTLFAADTPLDDRLNRLLQQASVVLNCLTGPGDPIHDRLVSATHARVISVDPRPTPSTLSTGIHITNQWAADVRTQGFLIGDPVPVQAQHEEPQTAQAAGCPQLVILHPGSGGLSKCWPVTQFLALADAYTRTNRQIAWMLGPAEREPGDDRFAAIAERAAARDEPLITEDELTAAASRITSASLYIGNDGGMTHVAAATGTPTLAIYTATDPRVWRPLGRNVRIIDARSIPDVGFAHT